MSEVTIRTRGLGKRFGEVTALDAVDVEARAGTVLGLLGHNGAGKTTLVHILSTLSQPSTGSATVAGFDVRTQGAQIRRRIGVTAQHTAVDHRLSGTANLVLVARLLGARPRTARRRAAQLVEAFGLTAAANRPAGSYSGGMRRRLDLAMSLVADPVVLFLDEPTTGLDPVSRVNLWETVEALVRQGTTVLLTTQDLHEADRLADRITVLSKGRVVASGTTAELKSQTGRRFVHLSVGRDRRERAAAALRPHGYHPTAGQGGTDLVVGVDASAELAVIVQILVAAEVPIDGLALSEPTLDDVYLALTSPGSATAAEPGSSPHAPVGAS
ncbi:MULTISPECIES: ABC transporter ATP-binding protein [Streptomyces]|uniref:ATP-binding cassette domain-containing protein n=2 Tax=Streptomyces viridosporus TaxID=67581 RepID=A0ABX6AM73_STRVD|nr:MULTISPECIES: ATP-binding cassette domain-containing protein [Streptomyces]EFE65516.1 FscTI [Streptomyces viridosporus ATCC 14672]PWJ03951.1 daunorubicin/doxorubicin resistance ABC transporter ATP-binding protein DrrA [Streptomyces sp. NWU49]QEU88975.1 ATP-binding cassette domain-containing protein [Streptomyces viridosporus T7A]